MLKEYNICNGVPFSQSAEDFYWLKRLPQQLEGKESGMRFSCWLIATVRCRNSIRKYQFLQAEKGNFF
jgi:hypothetical protein